MFDDITKLWTIGPPGWKVRKTDYHIHSRYSDGKDSLAACVEEASRKGLDAIAFTDHIWRTSEWVDSYVQECEQLRQLHPELDIRIGAEAKAINLKGDIDISPESAAKLDFVVGSVHRRLPEEPDNAFTDLRSLSPEAAAEAETEVIRGMVKNSCVNVIGHPMRLYYKFYFEPGKTDKPFPASLLKEILSAVAHSGKFTELNVKVPDLEAVVGQYRKEEVFFLLGSDAHDAGSIGNIPYEVITRQCHRV